MREHLRRLRDRLVFWAAPVSAAYVRAIRLDECCRVRRFLPPHARVLELGAGTGWQMLALRRLGLEVVGVDIPGSEYAKSRMCPVVEYDGIRLPFPDADFDAVFSSNVLEHIPDLPGMLAELRRVLKPGGVAVHLLPSAAWRAWTNLTHVLRYGTIPPRHGERGANAVAEMAFLTRAWWRGAFRRHGWEMLRIEASGLWYSGCGLAGPRIALRRRRTLARILGSTCHLMVLRPRKGS